ncbi:hypothetical protein NPIL_75801, partial [Nephila pilipes]
DRKLHKVHHNARSKAVRSLRCCSSSENRDHIVGPQQSPTVYPTRDRKPPKFEELGELDETDYHRTLNVLTDAPNARDRRPR